MCRNSLYLAMLAVLVTQAKKEMSWPVPCVLWAVQQELGWCNKDAVGDVSDPAQYSTRTEVLHDGHHQSAGGIPHQRVAMTAKQQWKPSLSSHGDMQSIS